MDRRIVCAAIRKDNETILGVRHFDSRMHDKIDRDNHSFGYWRDAEQGFIDNEGIFLTREGAYVVAKAANQIIRRCGGDEGVLFSENLY